MTHPDPTPSPAGERCVLCGEPGHWSSGESWCLAAMRRSRDEARAQLAAAWLELGQVQLPASESDDVDLAADLLVARAEEAALASRPADAGREDTALLNAIEREGLRCGAYYSRDGEGFQEGYFAEDADGTTHRAPTLRAAILAARASSHPEREGRTVTSADFTCGTDHDPEMH